jgi:hypothetical protein
LMAQRKHYFRAARVDEPNPGYVPPRSVALGRELSHREAASLTVTGMS